MYLSILIAIFQAGTRISKLWFYWSWWRWWWQLEL